MQFAKDSFYITLRNRLAQLNPSRTVTINGMTRSGILVAENERPGLQDLLLSAFCVNWGAEWAISAASGQIALHLLECTIEYRVDGTDNNGNADRGRQLTEMDTELRRMCLPPSAPVCDYTQSPAMPLGTTIFWTAPKLAAPKSDGKLLAGSATLQLYYFPEAQPV
jgi:hypothetical protein